MIVALQKPWTLASFLTWIGRQEGRYEFDGTAPVAIAGSTARHNRITLNIAYALLTRLRGTACSAFATDLGVRTIGQSVRYPDGLITCTKFPDSERLAPDVVVVFEVLSPDSGRRDRIDKAREYAAVRSILRYIIVESADAGLQVLHREQGGAPWMVQPLTGDDVLALPEVGIDLPVAELYEGVEFTEVL
jgi:Uma2 family endonuclease